MFTGINDEHFKAADSLVRSASPAVWTDRQTCPLSASAPVTSVQH